MKVSEAKRLRELRAENRKLKHLLAEIVSGERGLKRAAGKKLVRPAQRRQAARHLVEKECEVRDPACELIWISRSVPRYQAKGAFRMQGSAMPIERTGEPVSTLWIVTPNAERAGLVINWKRTYRIYTVVCLTKAYEKAWH